MATFDIKLSNSGSAFNIGLNDNFAYDIASVGIGLSGAAEVSVTGGTKTFDEIMSDGAWLDGSAESYVVYNEIMSGGLKLDGAADESLIKSSNTYNESMSGGLFANGAVVPLIVYWPIIYGGNIDHFTDANDTPLATHNANWAGTNIANAEIVNSQVATTGIWDNAGAIRYTASNSDTSQITITAGSQNGTRMVNARMSGSSQGYALIFRTDRTGIDVTKDGSWFAGLGINGPWPDTKAYNLTIVVSGTNPVTISAYVDGVFEGSTTDSTSPLPSGNPGFFLSANGQINTLDNWTDNPSLLQPGVETGGASEITTAVQQDTSGGIQLAGISHAAFSDIIEVSGGAKLSGIADVSSNRRYWLGTTSTSWNNSNNWAETKDGPSGASVPTSNDAVYFDTNVAPNPCTCDVSISCRSLTVTSSYSAKLDLADSSYSHAVSGNITLDGTGEFDCGNSTITTSGNFDYQHQATFTGGTSHIVMNGDGTVITFVWPQDVCQLSINGNVTSAGDIGYVSGLLTVAADKTFTISTSVHLGVVGATINGTVSISAGRTFGLSWSTSGTVTLGTTGSVTGAGTFRLYSSTADSLTLDNSAGGSFAPSLVSMLDSVRIKGGTYGGDWTCLGDLSSGTATFSFQGNCIFTGSVSFNCNAAGNYTITNAGNYSHEFRGGLSFAKTGAGTLTYTKGTGSITFSGAANQSVDFYDLTVEDIIVNKSAGTLTFTDGFTTDSFLASSNTYSVDFGDLSSTFNCIGNWTMTGAITAIDSGAGNIFNVGGNWATNSLSGAIWNDGAGTSWIYMTGASVTFNAGYNKCNQRLRIQAGAGVTSGINGFYGSTLHVYGTYTANVTHSVRYVTVYAGGTLTGSGDIYATEPIYSNNEGGTWSIATTNCGGYAPGSWAADSIFSGTTFTWKCDGATTTKTPVSVTFDCNVTIWAQTGSFTIDNTTNNPNWTFNKNVTIQATGGTLTWTKGSGTITLSGVGNQTVDFDARTIEDVVINNTGGLVTFSDGFTADSLTGTDGDCDFNGKTITVYGNVVLDKTTGFRLWDGSTADQSGAVIDYDGDLTLTGVNGDLLYITDLDFVNTVADSPTATYCYVTNSNRTGTGPDINARSATNIDNGGNTGWDFLKTYNETMSGGVGLDGSSEIDKTYTELMSGGIRLAGVGYVAFSDVVEVSGGVRLNGAFVYTQYYEVVMSNGVMSNGSAITNEAHSPILSGGVQINGTSDVEKITGSQVYNETMSDGIRVNGAAERVFYYTVEVSGGMRANGSVVPAATYAISVTGGVYLNGEAFVEEKSTYNEVMSGGVKLAGTGYATFSDVVEVSGGIRLSGVSERTLYYNIVAAGGLKLNGTPSVYPFPFKYDFGTTASPLAVDYTRVTDVTTYSASQGFGWTSGTIISRDRLSGTNLTKDFCFTSDGTFVVDLPNGSYEVTVIVGDKDPNLHDQQGIYLEGVLVDSITTGPGETVYKTYDVIVTDGQLTLRIVDLGGSDPNSCLAGLEIVKASPRGAALSAQVNASLTFNVEVSSGAKLSGEAFIETKGNYNEVMSGGMKAAGMSDVSFSCIIETSGSIRLGGVSGQTFYDIIEVSGGIKAGGACIIPPVVIGVFVKRSTWTSSYLNNLATWGVGHATHGWRLTDGPDQIENAGAATWSNIRTISIQFDQAVTVAQGDMWLYAGGQRYAPSSFAWDASTNTASWTYSRSLRRDRYLIVLAGTLISGEVLQCSWTTGQNYPSSGVPGDNFEFHWNLSIADFDLNGITQTGAGTGDYDLFSLYYTQPITEEGYRCDLNGDNNIDSLDYTSYSNSINATPLLTYPAGSPIWYASGGAKFGGSSDAPFSDVIEVSGGVSANSSVDATAIYDVVPVGGVQTNGQIDTTATYNLTSNNGVRVGGTSYYPFYDVVEVGGGIKLGGEAYVEDKGTYNEIMSGGVRAAGTSNTYFDYIVEVSGGIGLSGVSGQTFYDIIEVSGSIKAGGTCAIPPVVIGVFVKASSWNSAYMTKLQNWDVGDANFGWRLTDGPDQIANVGAATWHSIRTISIRFDQPVTVAQNDMRLYATGGVEHLPSDFNWDANTNTASWTYPHDLLRYRYLIVLAGTLISGEVLQGNWTTGQNYPSSGVPGDNFEFHWNLSTADLSLDGVTDGSDADIFQLYVNTEVTIDNYRCDLIGDDNINATDFAFFRRYNFSTPLLTYLEGAPIWYASGGAKFGGSSDAPFSDVIEVSGGVSANGSIDATAIYDVIPVGGVQTNGSVDTTATYNLTSNNGIRVGGTSYYPFYDVVEVSGGIKLGGQSPYTSGADYNMEGGIKTGGIAVQTLYDIAETNGGIRANGSATTVATYSIVVIGSVRANGSATTATTYAIAITGGVKLAGIGSATFSDVVEVDGGVKTNGVATTAATYNTIAITGGVKLAGISNIPFSDVMEVGGGVKVDGVATTTTTYAIAITGGVKLGGEAYIEDKKTYNEVMSSGIKLSGIAVDSGRYVVSISGGVKTQGIADVSKLSSHISVGGILVDGVSIVGRIYVQSVLGGTTVSGSANNTCYNYLGGQGGIETGGTIGLWAVYLWTTSGGIKNNGQSQYYILCSKESQGGCQCGGQYPLYTIHPEGGSLVGGETEVSVITWIEVGGGTLVGGTTNYSQEFEHKPEGGITVQGAADREIQFVPIISGGILVDGQFDSEYVQGGTRNTFGGAKMDGQAVESVGSVRKLKAKIARFDTATIVFHECHGRGKRLSVRKPSKDKALHGSVRYLNN